MDVRVEVRLASERWVRLDAATGVGEVQDGVAAEVRTRHSLSHTSVDTDGGLRLTEQLLRILVAVVHHQLRDLEATSVWESDQGDPRPIGIVGRVDLVVLQGGHREQDMGALPRECSSLEVDRKSVV